MSRHVTCLAPTNIAVIKYWGKRDEERILPINSSLSVTLNINDLCTRTTVMAREDFDQDCMWLNGVEVPMSNIRLQNCLRELRARAADVKNGDGDVVVRGEDLKRWKVHICSINTFPTAAGLASSAAGYACLVYTLAQLFGVQEAYPGELSGFARLGSGSACRSMYGGFVKWNMGEKEDGSDSLATQLASDAHWPDLQVLVLVVSDVKKETSSTTGMGVSVRTSPLLAHRKSAIVEPRLAEMERAIAERDFDTFGRLTIQDSNQFHACCLDTYPPIFYMNDISKRIVRMVHLYNEFCEGIEACYTFDAGPNAVIFLEEEHLVEFLSLVRHCFPPADDDDGFCTSWVDSKAQAHTLPNGLLDVVKACHLPQALKCVIHTTVGKGPCVVSNSDKSLLDVQTGLPKPTQ